MNETLEQMARRLYPDWDDEDIEYVLDTGDIWQDVVDEQVKDKDSFFNFLSEHINEEEMQEAEDRYELFEFMSGFYLLKDKTTGLCNANLMADVYIEPYWDKLNEDVKRRCVYKDEIEGEVREFQWVGGWISHPDTRDELRNVWRVLRKDSTDILPQEEWVDSQINSYPWVHERVCDAMVSDLDSPIRILMYRSMIERIEAMCPGETDKMFNDIFYGDALKGKDVKLDIIKQSEGE